jgi:HD superfamily phosphohydrolase
MKLIKDTIHGYIKIPDEYCHNLIDTEVFQRLRRIEQTSIRNLFPCAHHDRFVHSLGTYHLGSKAIDEIFRNSKNEIDTIKKKHDL